MSATEQNETKQEIREWLEDFHRTSALLDAEAWCRTFMTHDVELLFANEPTIRGADVRAKFAAQFVRLEKMQHDIVYFDYVAPKIYQKARIHYRVKGDDKLAKDVSVPGFAVFYVRKESDGRFLCYRAEIFLDLSELRQRMAAAADGSGRQG